MQAVYQQGVDISDKHIEAIVISAMLRKIKIEDAGDTDMLPGELVDIFRFERENKRVVANDGQPAVAMRVLLGITAASCWPPSPLLSAASFQETTRACLPEAVIKGKVDHLVGLKRTSSSAS